MRNALTSLTAAGLLERTAGRGTRVREMGDWHLLDPLMSEWMTGLVNLDPQLVRAIYAFRFSAEPVVAGLAAQAAQAALKRVLSMPSTTSPFMTPPTGPATI